MTNCRALFNKHIFNILVGILHDIINRKNIYNRNNMNKNDIDIQLVEPIVKKSIFIWDDIIIGGYNNKYLCLQIR